MSKKLRILLMSLLIAFSLLIPLKPTQVNAAFGKVSSTDNLVTSYEEAGNRMRTYFSDFENTRSAQYFYCRFPKSHDKNVIKEKILEHVYNNTKYPAQVRKITATLHYMSFEPSDVSNTELIKSLDEHFGRKLKSNEKYVYIPVFTSLGVNPYFNYDEVLQKAQKIVDSLQLKGLPAAKKVEKINHWFFQNVRYDRKYRQNGLANEVILHHAGICGNIASAFSLLASLAGLDVRYLANGSHAWNCVLIDGVWKYVDVTWNITELNEKKYLLCTKGQLGWYHNPYSIYDSPAYLGGYPCYGNHAGGWHRINNVLYYYNSNGTKAKGWVKTGRKWYFLDNKTGAMRVGWLKNNGKWYYLGSSGEMLTYWQTLKDSQGTFRFYLGSDGACRYGWHTISGKKYYFDGMAHMATGFKNINKKTYYFGNDGVMRCGWNVISKKWYFFNKDTGVMHRGWLKDKGKWYWLTSTGAMQTGWLKTGGKWYFLNESGAMVTGWKTIKYKNKNHKFYFNSSGAMVTGKQKINGKWYTFNSDGTLR